MKVALVYDWIYTFGGAERILLALHKIFPDAPLYTAVYQRKQVAWASVFQIKPSFLQKFPFASAYHYFYLLFTPIAFESFNFDSYDVVISITSADAKGIITKPDTLHVSYILTPTRYLWSGLSTYLKNDLTRFIFKPLITYLKKWDLVAKSRPDYLVAISNTVKRRIKKYYRLNSEVLYPPVNIEKFQNSRETGYPDFYLIVSRLIPFKRIDIAINACNYLRRDLVIAGSGGDYNRLKKIAGNKIKFTGNLTDDQLISYYQNCRAVIITSEEDLGLVAIEAQAAGKPVIAYKAGGVTETVIPGETGIFFSNQNSSSLINAIVKFEKTDFFSEKCFRNSQNYSEEVFLKNFKNQINKFVKLYFYTIKTS